MYNPYILSPIFTPQSTAIDPGSYTISSYTIPTITSNDMFIDDDDDDDPWDEDEDDDIVVHSPNSKGPLYSLESLEKYRTVLKPDVFDKFIHFFDTKAEVTQYSAKGMTYVKSQIYPHQAGSHSFYYSSDQLPYVAKTNQPCYGQLGGIMPNQTNLYIWLLNKAGQDSSEGFKPNHPFYKFFKDLRDNMFQPGTLDDVQNEVMTKYGFMMAPKLLESWPSPVIAGFAIIFRDGWDMRGDDPIDFLIKTLLYKGYSKSKPYGISGVGGSYLWKKGTWNEIKNLSTGTFNPTIMSLPSYAVDPDYSCWDSPLNNLWSDLDIQKGGKVITGRATDMVWDPWVVRNFDSSNFYGRNDGNSTAEKDGEVGEELRKYLDQKEPKTFEEAQELVTSFVKEKVNSYGSTDQLKAAA